MQLLNNEIGTSRLLAFSDGIVWLVPERRTQEIETS